MTIVLLDVCFRTGERATEMRGFFDYTPPPLSRPAPANTVSTRTESPVTRTAWPKKRTSEQTRAHVPILKLRLLRRPNLSRCRSIDGRAPRLSDNWDGSVKAPSRRTREKKNKLKFDRNVAREFNLSVQTLKIL